MTSKNLPTGLAAVEKAHQERSGPIESNWEGYALSGRVHYCRRPSSRRLFRITLPLLRPLNLIMAALKRDCQRSNAVWTATLNLVERIIASSEKRFERLHPEALMGPGRQQ
jgi:hypothetical protein